MFYKLRDWINKYEFDWDYLSNNLNAISILKENNFYDGFSEIKHRHIKKKIKKKICLFRSEFTFSSRI